MIPSNSKCKITPQNWSEFHNLAGLSTDDTEDVLDAVLGAHHVLVDVLDLSVHEALQQVQTLLRRVQWIIACVKNNDTQSDPREYGLVPKYKLVSIHVWQRQEGAQERP